MSVVENIQIEALSPEMHSDAARLLAAAFVTNPLHVAEFGPGALAKNEAFFRIGLQAMKGPKWVAVGESGILGVVHWIDSPRCQFSAIEKLRITPAMISGFGMASALRVGSWLSDWAKHDPVESHSHFGPIGVAPEAQGRHIGHLLMEYYCAQLDRSGMPSYLETDRPGNFTFYRRFDYETIAQSVILGVPNFFMRRPAS